MAMMDNRGHIRGSIGNLVYYVVNGRQLVRQKPRKPQKQLKTGPNYDRMKKNMLEFGKATRAATALKKVIGITPGDGADADYFGNLSATLLKVVKSDTINPPGSRSIMDGNLELLQGYKPYKKRSLERTCVGTFGGVVERDGGKVRIEIKRYDSGIVIYPPKEVAFYQLTVSCIEIDFETGSLEVTEKSTSKLPIFHREQSGNELKMTLTSDCTKALIVVLRMDLIGFGDQLLPQYRALEIVRALGPTQH